MYHRIPVHNMLPVFHIPWPTAISDYSSGERALMIACHSVCIECMPQCCTFTLFRPNLHLFSFIYQRFLFIYGHVILQCINLQGVLL